MTAINDLFNAPLWFVVACALGFECKDNETNPVSSFVKQHQNQPRTRAWRREINKKNKGNAWHSSHGRHKSGNWNAEFGKGNEVEWDSPAWMWLDKLSRRSHENESIEYISISEEVVFENAISEIDEEMNSKCGIAISLTNIITSFELYEDLPTINQLQQIIEKMKAIGLE